jgi:hypothetical protein
MKESDNSKIHISNNILCSVCLQYLHEGEKETSKAVDADGSDVCGHCVFRNILEKS